MTAVVIVEMFVLTIAFSDLSEVLDKFFEDNGL